MKIALLGLENQARQAMAAAAERIGHTVMVCRDSGEIESRSPDFIIASSGAPPKLHDVAHYMVVDEPRDVFLEDRRRLAALLTADGYFTTCDTTARFIRDLTYSTGWPREPRCLEAGYAEAGSLLSAAADYHRRISVRRDDPAAPQPLISIVMRCGGRSGDLIRRAIESLARQTAGRFDIVLVRHSPVELDQILALRFPNVEAIRVVEAAPGFRSTSLCAGLAAVKGDSFAILDDDDWLFCNHFERLFHTVRGTAPKPFFAYSGTIRGAPEGRQLTHFGIEDVSDLFAISHAFNSHCFVASSDLIHAGLLEDPRLYTCEDSYLILSLLQQVNPRFSYAATAVQDVSACSRSNYDDDPRRFEDELTVQLRLRGGNLPRPGLVVFDDWLRKFWETRPGARPPSEAERFAQIPAECLECVAGDFEGLHDNQPIQTPQQPWAYAAQLATVIPPGRAGAGFFRVEALVTSGPIGIGVLNAAETDFLIRKPLDAAPDAQTVFLPVDDMSKLGRLVIQNWDARGVHSLQLRSLSLWTKKPAKK